MTTKTKVETKFSYMTDQEVNDKIKQIANKEFNYHDFNSDDSMICYKLYVKYVIFASQKLEPWQIFRAIIKRYIDLKLDIESFF